MPDGDITVIGDAARTVSVQTVLYFTPPETARSAAETVAASAALARREGFLADWTYALGDCSGGSGILTEEDLAAIRATIAPVGGRLLHRVFEGNLGHGGGHNRLADETDADLLLFLNPDARTAPETLVRLMEAMEPGVGAVDGRQLPLEHPKDFEEGRGDTAWVSGACLMTPRSVFEAVGGFDHDTFFLYCDDVDYSWRVRLAGHRTVHVPGARVFHDKRLDARGAIVASDAEHYYSAEAALLLAAKYSRTELVAELLTTYDRPDASDDMRRAAAEYRRREAAGLLPESLDPEREVSTFVDGNYAVHRF